MKIYTINLKTFNGAEVWNLHYREILLRNKPDEHIFKHWRRRQTPPQPKTHYSRHPQAWIKNLKARKLRICLLLSRLGKYNDDGWKQDALSHFCGVRSHFVLGNGNFRGWRGNCQGRNDDFLTFFDEYFITYMSAPRWIFLLPLLPTDEGNNVWCSCTRRRLLCFSSETEVMSHVSVRMWMRKKLLKSVLLN